MLNVTKPSMTRINFSGREAGNELTYCVLYFPFFDYLFNTFLIYALGRGVVVISPVLLEILIIIIGNRKILSVTLRF